MTGKVQGNKSHHAEDDHHGAYMSNPVAVRALMGVARLPAVIWEPAAGDGNGIVKPLRQFGRTVHASDLFDRGCPDCHHGVDFVKEPLSRLNATVNKYGIKAIVTNPPYHLDEEFIERSVAVCPDVYMLLRLTYLEGGQKSPARDRVLDSIGLANVFVFRERLPMMHRAGWVESGGKATTSQVAYAWFHWRRGFRGTAKAARLSWRNPKPILEPRQVKEREDKFLQSDLLDLLR